MKNNIKIDKKISFFILACLFKFATADAMLGTVKRIGYAPIATAIGTYNFVVDIPNKVTNGVSNYFDPINTETGLQTPAYKSHMVFGALAGGATGAGISSGLVYLFGGNAEEIVRSSVTGGIGGSLVGLPAGAIICSYRRKHVRLLEELGALTGIVQANHEEVSGKLDILFNSAAALTSTVQANHEEVKAKLLTVNANILSNQADIQKVIMGLASVEKGVAGIDRRFDTLELVNAEHHEALLAAINSRKEKDCFDQVD